MILTLARLPESAVVGIYNGKLPERMRFLHPSAARSFMLLATQLQEAQVDLVVSDMYRSAESSLAAVAAGRGAKAPGYSGHNYGFSIDLDVDAILKSIRWKKPDLDAFMSSGGWYCHRKDEKRGTEDWHYNFLGSRPVEVVPLLAAAKGRLSTAASVELRIVTSYGAAMKLTPTAAQAALAVLRLYSGKVDGKLGPLSKASIAAFQRAWKLTPTGDLDARTQRTLAFVTAGRTIQPG